jgi:hypothetical protein
LPRLLHTLYSLCAVCFLVLLLEQVFYLLHSNALDDFVASVVSESGEDQWLI